MQPITGWMQPAVWRFTLAGAILLSMMTKSKPVLLIAMVLLFSAAFSQNAMSPSSGPEYTSDSQLKFPEHYRDWVYLTTGFDMSYNPAMRMGHHMFDNVFVNPEAYKAFVDRKSTRLNSSHLGIS